jgi:hypothetical protein
MEPVAWDAAARVVWRRDGRAFYLDKKPCARYKEGSYEVLKQLPLPTAAQRRLVE